MFTAARRVNVLAAHLSRTTPIAARAPTTGSTLKVGSFFSSPAVTPAAMSAAKEIVDKAIAENNVVVFSKSYCPVSCANGGRCDGVAFALGVRAGHGDPITDCPL